MPNYLFSYRTPSDYVPTPDTRAEWEAFFGQISTQLEDIGNPIFASESVGTTDADTRLGGYSIIAAANLQEATRLASDCPLVARGGGVEVGEITPLSAIHEQAGGSEQATTA